MDSNPDDATAAEAAPTNPDDKANSITTNVPADTAGSSNSSSSMKAVVDPAPGSAPVEPTATGGTADTKPVSA